MGLLSLLLLIQAPDEAAEFRRLEQIQVDKPQTPAAEKAAAEQLEIAERWAEEGPDQNAIQKIFLNKANLAEEALIRIQERYPSSSLAERANWTEAKFEERLENYSHAEQIWSRFILNFPKAEKILEAQEFRIRSAAKSYRGPEYDSSCLERIASYVQKLERQDANFAYDFLKRFPFASEDQLNEERAKVLWVQAAYYRRKEDKAAEKLILSRLKKKYPTASFIKEVDERLQKLAK